jgi:hypothetical protein
MKMRQLVLQSGDEIAWHGFVKRDGMNFTLYDVIMYPQYNSAATTKSDEEEYSKWILRQYEFENFCDMKMHGHSHVNMGCTPSGTDMQFRENILKNLKKDSFYIFMIMNKQGSFTIELYDYVTGMIYDTSDITVYTDDPETTRKAQEWASTAIKNNVREVPFTWKKFQSADSSSTTTSPKTSSILRDAKGRFISSARVQSEDSLWKDLLEQE